MTNEELAIQIQLGHTEHYTELWHNVRRLMHKILYAKLSRNYIAAGGWNPNEAARKRRAKTQTNSEGTARKKLHG